MTEAKVSAASNLEKSDGDFKVAETAACCEVHKMGKCDAVFTCCDKCPTFFRCDYDAGRMARQPWPCDFCPHSDYITCLEVKIEAAKEHDQSA